MGSQELTGIEYPKTLALEAVTMKIRIDFSHVIGPARHVANAALYGVTAEMPSDETLARVKPSVTVNPAVSGEDAQQIYGAAPGAMRRIARVGGRLQLRLADFFPGWYRYGGWKDWEEKIRWTAEMLRREGLEHVHSVEIWNEPECSWHGRYLTPIAEKRPWFVRFKVRTPQDGRYEVRLRYASETAGDVMHGKLQIGVVGLRFGGEFPCIYKAHSDVYNTVI